MTTTTTKTILLSSLLLFVIVDCYYVPNFLYHTYKHVGVDFWIFVFPDDRRRE